MQQNQKRVNLRGQQQEENDYLNEMAQIRAEELSIRYSHLRPNGKLISGNGINGREFDS